MGVSTSKLDQLTESARLRSLDMNKVLTSKAGPTLDDTTCSADTSFNNSDDASLTLDGIDDTQVASAEEQIRRTQRQKELPSTANFASGHILINQLRIRLGKKPLYRCLCLDNTAQQRAERMALAQKILENPIDNEFMAENVAMGHSIRIIHQLCNDSQMENILNENYTDFGIGCAKGSDGQIYMSQIFQAPASEEARIEAERRREESQNSWAAQRATRLQESLDLADENRMRNQDFHFGAWLERNIKPLAPGISLSQRSKHPGAKKKAVRRSSSW